ncbi:MAG: alpha/beta hydrolase [Flavobacteriales bacterium]|nr:alpha/beta hydrolase [Flavobacteriales bacterium]MCB9203856.1 alpha/beta hydrolase [Flavobacteriales bacterium]
MKQFFQIAFIVLVPTVLFGQDCTSERYLSNIFQSSVNQDVVYGNSPALTAVYVAENVTVNQAMTMDVYYPAGDALEKRPLVMLAYGGGYLFGTKEDEDVAATCDSLAKKGYVTASINYRMNLNAADPNSAVRAIYRAAQDYHSAIRYLKEYANTFGIDTNYIFVGGVSAGGFSAMHAVYLDDNERPAATYQGGLLGNVPDLGCISCAGNSFNHSAEVRGIINLWGALMDTSYIQQDELVPMTLFHGTNDLIVPYNVGVPFTALFLMPDVYGSSLIAERVNNLGGNAELNLFPGVGHNIWGLNVNNVMVGGPTEHWSPITDSIISFLYENIRPDEPLLTYTEPFCSADTAWLQATNAPSGGWICWSVEQGEIVVANADSSMVGVVWNSAGSHQVSATAFNHLEARSYTHHAQVSVYISPVVSITDLGGTLQASGNYPSYQWYLNGMAISGADQPQYSPMAAGTYTVEAITTNGCGAFSEPLVLVGIEEAQFSQRTHRVRVIDLQGREIGMYSSYQQFMQRPMRTKGMVLVQFLNEQGTILSTQRVVISEP